ncbi:hypothetical protein Pla110_34270 [Polystyrenella longa]|uniref:UPF0235 protein Pla110_34270 n=1 Tax=Polystyrenella longa TaxID=2528007 RepID=A0A518CR48_9PLAN|nr:DUF167 domain-containing protein [Polystyrenella longa]QDU81683.1 hypothetical protein Pla110_34270 [Polystyrenella longa]
MLLPTISDHPDGLILPLKVSPKAKRNGVTGIHDDQLKISVTAVPEKGKANLAVLKLLAKELSIARSQLEILRGDTSPQKQVLLRNISRDELESQLTSLLQE